jgi:hypothetical protein
MTKSVKPVFCKAAARINNALSAVGIRKDIRLLVSTAMRGMATSFLI